MDLAYAFTAGAVATVNPCGWALLPVWLAQRLAGGAGAGGRLCAAALHGGQATLGCLAVFAVAGLALGLGASWLGPAMPIAGLAIGLVTVIAGILWFLRPRRLVSAPALCRLPGSGRGSVLFGAGFGVMSLSCTLPIFLAVAGLALSAAPPVAALILGAYGAGMGTVLIAVSLAGALAGGGRREPTVGGRAARLHHVAGAALTLGAGLYVTLYWAGAVFGGPAPQSAILTLGERVSSALRIALTSPAAQAVMGAFALVLVATLLLRAVRRRRFGAE